MADIKLYIHIGPPKTATTSLQYFFQELNIDNLYYGGIIQPRGSSTLKSLMRLVYSDICSGVYNNRNEVIEQVNSNFNKNIVLSEEMILLENKDISWRKKVKNLYDYFKDLDPIIIFTLREPRDAIISYYQELYHGLDEKMKKDFYIFIESDYCDIYRYEDLLIFLRQTGFKKIKTVDYEKLINGDQYLDSFLSHSKSIPRIRISLKKENISWNKNGFRYTKPIKLKKQIKKKLVESPIYPIIAKNKYWKDLSKIFFRVFPEINLSGQIIEANYKENDFIIFQTQYSTLKKESLMIE